MPLSWIRKLFPTTSRNARRYSNRRRSLTFRPAAEDLEGRDVPTFLAPVSLNTGFAVTAANTGDFNGDGKMDIVCVGSVSGRGVVSVEMNNGDGTYSVGAMYNTGNTPIAVKTGDFDGDGKADVVTLAAYYTGALTTLHGHGDGSFDPYQSYTVLTPPTDIEVEDVTGDGKVDLVAVNDYFNTLSVFANTGTGTFGPKVDYAAGTQPWAVAVADFNGDGKKDVVATSVSSTGGGLGFFAGNGTGGFGPRVAVAAGGTAQALTLGDFNGDGKMDVAVANSSGATTVTVSLGNGDGTFQAGVSTNIGNRPLDIKSADFNGDGKLDLVERTTVGFMVEAGNGDGTFQTPLLVTGGAGNSSLIADFNGDGVADIASTSTAGTVMVQINANDGLTGATHGAGFQLSVPAGVMVGIPTTVTVRAVDASGNLDPTFLGNVTLTSSDASVYGVVTFTAADAGVKTATVTFFSVGTQTLTASAPLFWSDTQSVPVAAAPATRFAVTAVPTAVAGSPTTFMVVATDTYGNMVADYTGTVHLTSSDRLADLPADYTFTAADGGTHTFTAVLKTAGAQTFGAADATALNVIGNSNYVSVSPTVGVSFTLSGGGGFIGVAHPVTIQARDVYGNATTLYNGTVHLSASDQGIQGDRIVVNCCQIGS